MDRAITERGGGGVLGFLNFPLRYLVMKKKKKGGGSPTSELFGF